MSLLENLAGGLMGGGDSPVSAVLELVQKYPGGLAGLVNTFQEKGLGGVAASWVSTGSNLPISASQITSVLGSGQLSDIASKLGVSPGDASGQLANMLPQVIDKLTPGGEIDEGAMGQGMDLLKGLLG
ncbi:MAG TPA: YidB family protein [Bryobacteraceae bacterium]|nr:YidB family protein [Bryobacteraceae bacterium]